MSERAARQCNGKRRYRSARKAQVAAADSQHVYGDPMEAYPRSFCKGWHVGNRVSRNSTAGRRARREQLKEAS